MVFFYYWWLLGCISAENDFKTLRHTILELIMKFHLVKRSLPNVVKIRVFFYLKKKYIFSKINSNENEMIGTTL